MKKKTNILDTLDKLADAERVFLLARFLAPVAARGRVAVRIGGVRCELAVEPKGFTGWGVFRPASHTRATLEAEATMAQRRRYLELFAAVGLILVERRQADGEWLALPARAGDRRFTGAGPVVVRLVEEADRFDFVRARFDGGGFWFDEPDPQAEPSVATKLREADVDRVDPERLDVARSSAEQRAAYAWVRGERLRRQREALARREQAEVRRRLAEQDRHEGRLRRSLEHASAQLREFTEHADGYRVAYTVNGARHTSLVDKRDLTVQSAGVCLSGEDAKFDLASLVSVLREGQERGGAYHGLHV